MALFKYFKVQKDLLVSPLPNPNGSLRKVVDRAAIEVANEEVAAVLNADKRSRLDKKRWPYLKATPTQKMLVTRYAAENGVASAIRHLQKDFPANSMKESTIRGWRNEYQNQLKSKK